MKGFISEIGWTTFLLIAFMVMALMGIIAVLFVGITGAFGGPDSDTVEFLAANNKPYIAGSVLAYSLAGDRQFLENAIEILAAGSKDNAGSKGLTTYLKGVFSSYGNDRFMSIAVIDAEEKELYYADNVPKRCGNDLTGFCVEKYRWESVYLAPTIRIPWRYTVGCTDGRKRIDKSKYVENICEDSDEICCVEDGSDVSGVWQWTAEMCGDPKIGVCDYSGGCSAGRIRITAADADCLTGGKGACCVPLEASALTAAGIAASAEIPILYSAKDGAKTGAVQVTMG